MKVLKDTNNMRIAYVAVKGIPIGGGIEKVTEEIGSRLAARGHRITVYSSRDYGTADGVYKGMDIMKKRDTDTVDYDDYH